MDDLEGGGERMESKRSDQDFDFLDDFLENKDEVNSEESLPKESVIGELKEPSAGSIKRRSNSNLPPMEEEDDAKFKFANEILRSAKGDAEDLLTVIEIEDEEEVISDSLREALEWVPEPPRTTPELLINEWHTSGWVGYLHIDRILTDGILTGASDVHISADTFISMTIDGDIVRYDEYEIPDTDTMQELIHGGLLTHQQQQVLNVDYEFEGAYNLRIGPFAGRRTRLTIGKTFGKYFLVFRIISDSIPELKDLNVEPELIRWSKYPNGLFLLCGPTGSGKSTTLASLIQNLQRTTRKKIITIEKPIEYIYSDGHPALLIQRSVGEDTRGFYEGLTSAMRQSPNVILLGEVRNTEEVQELLRAGETGHLAISTMHTNSAPTTINRIQNLFRGNEQAMVMSTLADILRGIGNQVLVKRKDGGGRFAVRELLTITGEVKDMIAKGDIKAIRNYQIARESTIEHKLAQAVKQGLCTYEDALDHTADPELFEELMGKLYKT